jgi:hypothetical protein
MSVCFHGIIAGNYENDCEIHCRNICEHGEIVEKDGDNGRKIVGNL